MDAEEVIEVLMAVNEDFAAKALDLIPPALEIVAPYVNAAGPDARAAYIAAKQRLATPTSDLIDPRNGDRLAL